MKRWAGLHDFNYREPCPIFSAAPGGVSGQPGNNGSYAPGVLYFNSYFTVVEVDLPVLCQMQKWFYWSATSEDASLYPDNRRA